MSRKLLKWPNPKRIRKISANGTSKIRKPAFLAARGTQHVSKVKTALLDAEPAHMSAGLPCSVTQLGMYSLRGLGARTPPLLLKILRPSAKGSAPQMLVSTLGPAWLDIPATPSQRSQARRYRDTGIRSFSRLS